MTKSIYSASEFSRVTGISAPTRRALVTVGILKPLRTGGGWAVFTADDIDRARAWKENKAATKQARASA